MIKAFLAQINNSGSFSGQLKLRIIKHTTTINLQSNFLHLPVQGLLKLLHQRQRWVEATVVQTRWRPKHSADRWSLPKSVPTACPRDWPPDTETAAAATVLPLVPAHRASPIYSQGMDETRASWGQAEVHWVGRQRLWLAPIESPATTGRRKWRAPSSLPCPWCRTVGGQLVDLWHQQRLRRLCPWEGRLPIIMLLDHKILFKRLRTQPSRSNRTATSTSDLLGFSPSNRTKLHTSTFASFLWKLLVIWFWYRLTAPWFLMRSVSSLCLWMKSKKFRQ